MFHVIQVRYYRGVAGYTWLDYSAVHEFVGSRQQLGGRWGFALLRQARDAVRVMRVLPYRRNELRVVKVTQKVTEEVV